MAPSAASHAIRKKRARKNVGVSNVAGGIGGDDGDAGIDDDDAGIGGVGVGVGEKRNGMILSKAPHGKAGGLGQPEPRGFTTDPSRLATMSRSERKRHREKKRRSDVNRGFEDLVKLLVEVDAGVRTEVEEERSRRAQARAAGSAGAGGAGAGGSACAGKKGGPGPGPDPGETAAPDDTLLSRVDVIDRATTVLRRLHGENQQRKTLIEHLLAQGESVAVAQDQSTAPLARPMPTPMEFLDQPSWVRRIF